MAKYNELGVDKKGNVDPLRKMVHNIVGLLPSTPGSRPMADDLYATLKKAKGGGGGGGDDGGGGGGGGGGGDGGDGGGGDKDEGKDDVVKKVKPTFLDVDFTMKGDMKQKPVYIGKRPPNYGVIDDPVMKVKTMKSGGLVRGCGKAQRGRGRGKMV